MIILDWFKQQKGRNSEIPYVTGNAVGGSPNFIGRTDILKAVDDVLYDPKQNSLVLFGQRRIGKTSILLELKDKLSTKGKYHTIYFDLMDKAHNPLEVILNDLATTISQKLQIPQWDNTDCKFHKWLEDSLENDQLTDSSLVLLFDEFDALKDTKAEQMRDDFFRYLREDLLSINLQRLNFVFAIGRNIDDFKAALALFKNIPSYRVSLLTESETKNLIRLSEDNKSLYWSSRATKQILELTNGHPLLTQALCSCVWHNSNGKKISSITKENIDCVLTNTSQNALEWLWDGLPPACKIVTAAFAELGKKNISHRELSIHLQNSGIGMVIDELDIAPKNLKEWDIIEEDKQRGYQFRVELFRRWVVEHKPLKEIMQPELVRIRVESDEYYKQGQVFYNNKQFDEAVDKLSTTIRINPNHIEAQKLLAKVFIEKGDIQAAQEDLEKFYQSYPDIARPQLIELLWQQIKVSNSKKKQLSICDKILEYDPNYLNAKKKRKEIVLWQGQRFEDDEEYEKSIEIYQKAGLKNKALKLWYKSLKKKYGRAIKITIVFFGISLISYFILSPFLGEYISWNDWGPILSSIILGILFTFLTNKISFTKTKIKRF
ncbi:hypothetical protein QUF50_04175 [Thiotrichales bacterium HSG1]|nr:hypothetical protein [Thiotrichales bacterium HSG1]